MATTVAVFDGWDGDTLKWCKDNLAGDLNISSKRTVVRNIPHHGGTVTLKGGWTHLRSDDEYVVVAMDYFVFVFSDDADALAFKLMFGGETV